MKAIIQNLYAFKDVRTGAFLPPFASTDTPEALSTSLSREIKTGRYASRPELKFYHLFFIGTYNDVSGVYSLAEGSPLFVDDLGPYFQEAEYVHDQPAATAAATPDHA